MTRSAIHFTATDYRALPDSAPRMELIDGEFEMAPAPSPKHQSILRNLVEILLKCLEKNPLGKLLFAPCDVYLGDSDVVQPDILFLLNGHLDREREDGIYGSPDLTVEVISPTSGAIDMTTKREIYRRGGVTEYWIVDPKTRTLTLFRLQEPGSPRVFRDNEALSSPLLPSLNTPVALVFA